VVITTARNSFFIAVLVWLAPQSKAIPNKKTTKTENKN